MTELHLKPATVTEKSEQKKVSFAKELFSQTSINGNISLKAKSIGTWTIEKEERCNICWVNIKQGEAFTRCTSCNNKFHTDHWREWILTKQYCPICKVKTTF